jgi:hypothetical protein
MLKGVLVFDPYCAISPSITARALASPLLGWQPSGTDCQRDRSAEAMHKSEKGN